MFIWDMKFRLQRFRKCRPYLKKASLSGTVYTNIKMWLICLLIPGNSEQYALIVIKFNKKKALNFLGFYLLQKNVKC